MEKQKKIRLKVNIRHAVQLQGVSIQTMPFLLAIGISFIILYIKSVDTNLTEFYDRAIGCASINGVDASVRIDAFWACILIFLATIIIGNYLISRIDAYILCRYPNKTLEFESELFFEFSILLLIDRLIFLLSFVKDRNVQMPVMLPVVFVVVCIHLFLNIVDGDRRVTTERLPLADAAELVFPIPLTYFFLLIFSINEPTIEIMSWKSLLVYMIIYLILRFVGFAFLNLHAAVYALVPVSFFPAVYIAANEVQYTLTKRGVVFRPKQIAFVFSSCILALAVMVYIKKRSSVNAEGAGKIFQNVVVPVQLVTLVLFLNHMQLISPGFDYLHNGNGIVPAQQLYQFGKIPLLDYWAPQHWPVGPFLYSLLNGCNYFEPMLWYAMFDYAVCILLGYFVLRQFLSARWTALLLCFTPVMAYMNTYYMIALLPMLYIGQMRTKKRIRDYGLVILLALAAFAYMSSAGKIAVLSSLILVALSCSSVKDVKNAAVGIAGVVVPLGTLYFLLVLLRGESLRDRLVLISSMANCDIQIGSYTSFISDSSTPFEILTYYGLFPLAGILSLIFIMRIQKKKDKHFSFIFLTAASIICSLRGFARHSLWEGNQTDFYLLLIVLLPVVFLNNKTIQKVFLGLVIAVLVLLPYESAKDGLLSGGVPDFTFQKYEVGDERCDTVGHESYPRNLRKVLDMVLEEDQTFFEGVNAHLLYSLMEREAPFLHHSVQIIYSQPPQEAYIHLFEKAYEDEKIPIVIYGQAENVLDDIDGIPAELSLFKLDDFIYTHYEPWIWADGFHLWKAKNSSLTLPDTDHLLQDVSIVPANDACVNDLDYDYSEDMLKLQCGSMDPWMVLPLSDPLAIDAETENGGWLKMVFRSSVSGSMQVFFDLEGFREEDASITEVAAGEEFHTVYLPIPEKSGQLQAVRNIRINPPADAQFEIQSIRLVSRSVVFDDKSYLQQDFNMQMLPYIWGNYDEKTADNFPEELWCISERFVLSADSLAELELDPDINKEDGNYIYFRINAAEPGILILQYGSNIMNSCQFNLIPGVQDYLVRISSQYNWVSEPQDYMTVQSSIPVTVEKTAILKGD